MPTVSLSAGQAAVLRDPEDLTRGDVVKLRAWMAEQLKTIDLGDEDLGEGAEIDAVAMIGLSDTADDLALAALIESWTLPGPVTFDAVRALRNRDWQALRDEAGSGFDLMVGLMPRPVVDAEPGEDPTTPSAGTSGTPPTGG